MYKTLIIFLHKCVFFAMVKRDLVRLIYRGERARHRALGDAWHAAQPRPRGAGSSPALRGLGPSS